MSWLHRLSIAQKIQVLVTLSVVGIASVGGLALWSNGKLSSAARNVGSVQLPAVRNMTLSDMMHDGLRALVYQALLAAQDPSAATDSAAVLADVQDFGANFRGFLTAIDALDVRAETRAAIEEARPSIEAYIGSCETIARHGAEGDLAAARAELPRMEELFGVLEESLGALGERIEGDADSAVEESDAVAGRARTSLIGALVVLGLGAWALGRFIARQITEPLEAAIEVLESGDTSLLAAVDTDDEIGRMARAVEQTVQTLEESKVELEAQKEHLASSASAMERSAKEAAEQARMAAELKQRAEEQAVLAEEQAQHAAEQAKNAAEQAQRAEEIAAEAARVAAMVENSPKPMMFADEGLVVRYANPAAKSGLSAFGAALTQRTLEGCDLSVFYRHPDGNERFFRNARNLPYATRFVIGNQTVALSCSAIAGPSGERMGTLLAWENVTEQLAAERAAQEASEREARQAHELQERVDRMLEVVDAAARGDLTVMIAVDGEDSIGHMAEALNRFLGDLRSSLGRIRTGAESLAKSAESLHGVSQAMSTEAAQTSSQVQVASGAADEVSSSVRTVAEGNHGMEQSIREIAQSASAAARVARQAVETATSTNATVTELDQASRQIGVILKTITTIAEQTNLLALNATIEAARAGEMGKGFAVVANEVKELAQETAKATKDITGMIGAMQAGSRGAVEAISRISTIIGEIDELQSTIVAAVEEQTSATSEMGRHLTVATRSATQITQNMAGVAQAAHSTSDGAANTLDVAVSVSDMAEELLGAVGQFRV